MKMLDLYCGAGGCSEGYRRAGFKDILGIDLSPQRHYPFWFMQWEAVDFIRRRGREFDFLHASPPCQEYCPLRHLYPDRKYPDLVAVTRDALIMTGKPYVIENVPGSPLENPIQLCGSAFGLRVRRHRLFESNIELTGVACNHKQQGPPIDVSGTGGRRVNRRPDDHGGNTNKPRSIMEARQAMGIDWMTRMELSQAIPPAYTEYIGKQIIKVLKENTRD